MNKILGSRGIGKSTQLLDYAFNNKIKNIICLNPTHQILLANNREYNLCFNFIPFSDEDKISELLASGEPFVVDELDHFLKYYFKNLKGYTNSI